MAAVPHWAQRTPLFCRSVQVCVRARATPLCSSCVCVCARTVCSCPIGSFMTQPCNGTMTYIGLAENDNGQGNAICTSALRTAPLARSLILKRARPAPPGSTSSHHATTMVASTSRKTPSAQVPSPLNSAKFLVTQIVQMAATPAPTHAPWVGNRRGRSARGKSSTTHRPASVRACRAHHP